MSEKVSITKSKLDSLANAIASVGETSVPKTIAQMESAVLELTIPPNLQSKTITPSITQQIVSPDSGYDGFSSVTVNAIELQEKTITPTTEQQIVIPDNSLAGRISVGTTSTFYNGNTSISVFTIENQNYIANATYSFQGKLVGSNGGVINLRGSKTGSTGSLILEEYTNYTYNNINIAGIAWWAELTTTTREKFLIQLGSGYSNITWTVAEEVIITNDAYETYDGLSKVTVNAMPSGTAGTPTATKGTVSNHSVSITPSVTNTTGFITGSTINGTPVTVDVTELESGTKSITENGTGISVSGYSTVDVDVSGGGGTLGDVTVPSAVNKQTIYPDGCQNVVYPIGSTDSMANLGWAITIPSDDVANMAFYVPYEVRGTLRTSTTGGDKTSDISITGTTYRVHNNNNRVIQKRFGFPFSYSGDNMVDSIYVGDTSDGFVVYYLASGRYTVSALSDLTIKEKGFREEVVMHQFTDESTSLTFSWDSSSFSNGDICAVSGAIMALDRNGNIVYRKSFDVQFPWDGETHTFNVMSGETIVGNCNITPTTVTYTNVLTARITKGGVNVSKYEEYDGLSSVAIQPGTV